MKFLCTGVLFILYLVLLQKLVNYLYLIFNVMNQVVCEHPRIILNPKAPELLLRYKHWILNGKEFKSGLYFHHWNDFDYRFFSVRCNDITIDNWQEHVIIDDETGETYNIYLCVPCHKCDICRVRDMNSFVKRCEYESQVYNSMPWFVTFTYAQAPDDGVSVTDCQLFFKRLRINLERAGYNFRIRYVMVAEYGTKSHRPHYHGIFWNINSFTADDVQRIRSIFEKSWKHGFITSRCIDMKDDNAFYYTFKYVKKGSDVPEGKNDTFVLSSRKNGGIGAPFIDKHIKQLRRNCHPQYRYRNRFTGKIENFQWNNYVINRVFPSFCRSVNSAFRTAVQEFNYYCIHDNFVLKNVDLKLWQFHRDICKKLRQWFWIPCRLTFKQSKAPICDLNFLYEYKSTIDKYLNRIDFVLAEKLDCLRKRFLGRMFLHESPIDIAYRAYQCRDILSRKSSITAYV